MTDLTGLYLNYWLLYAGPENYLCADGIRDFSAMEVQWSGAPGMKRGDRALLYRKSMKKFTLQELSVMSDLSLERAMELKRHDVGSDIADLWEIVAGDQGPMPGWNVSCLIRHVACIRPPLRLTELKSKRELLKWKDLRWNFQAQGRDALEIPEFAWVLIKQMINERLSHPL